MERELLRVLDFDLTQPTIKTFLRRYIKAASGARAAAGLARSAPALPPPLWLPLTDAARLPPPLRSACRRDPADRYV